jgi:hypothetical protein
MTVPFSAREIAEAAVEIEQEKDHIRKLAKMQERLSK